jgi:hypothetical protein
MSLQRRSEAAALPSNMLLRVGSSTATWDCFEARPVGLSVWAIAAFRLRLWQQLLRTRRSQSRFSSATGSSGFWLSRRSVVGDPS